MPHLYIKTPQTHLIESWKHDHRNVKLVRVQENGEILFIKFKALDGIIRISLLPTNITLILNRHKRILMNFARCLNANILKSNLGEFGEDEKGLETLLDEKRLLVFNWHKPVPKYLEIGSGNGTFLIKMARENPGALYFGTEINGFVLKKALRSASKFSLNNVYYLKKDAEYLLRFFIPNNTLDAIYINFPDPWFKKRHEKRKIISPHAIETFAKALKSGGMLFFTTDDLEYATRTEELFYASPFFTLKKREISGLPRFHTKYERKWLAKGKVIYTFIFQRNENPLHNRNPDYLLESFTVPVRGRLSSGTIMKRDNFTAVFRDVYRGEMEDIINAIISHGRFTWFVLFTWQKGTLHYSPDLNHKFLTRQVKEKLERLLR